MGSVSFAMTNSAAGIPAAIRVVGRASQSATVSTRYKHPLEVRLLDASGTPLQGVSVTFTLGAGGSGSSASERVAEVPARASAAAHRKRP